MAKKVVLKKKGKKPVSFTKGGLHRSLGVSKGQKIPTKKLAQAKAGKFGAKAKKQANLAEGLLKKGRKTALGNKRKSKRNARGIRVIG